eukprot:CAMPEP_0184347194 /NCGR_PEP_ID=MMETSP1089-20130417/15337_1 /TAXON_ID=38269 ORGANISM="Gloeochaete wittrockiana, Strain SAG46.84" /NCGR_SAMPLE_ID=MMETSP1089 /ASSEMBLY_ACC=CAM_ASM_000445 /LENGTH=201 /DNA_ID=CAMNT_0026678147 /DNA_START=33 /DNA_END=638 /DNA_ORIENTATION=+
MSDGDVTQLKLVFLGEAGVGKSSIALRFTKNEFNVSSESTIGAAFLTAQIMEDKHLVKFEIWDTAGQERFHSLAPMYYRGAQAAIVVFDITNQSSFSRAQTWIQELQVECNANVVIVLAGNKLDMASARQISTHTARDYADKNGLMYIECSAKTDTGIQDLFKSIAKKIPKTQAKAKSSSSTRIIPKAQPSTAPSGSGTCC